MATQDYPKWLNDVLQLLPVRAQFVLSGNIRDRVEIWLGSGQAAFFRLEEALWHALSQHGYEGILIWDRVEGLRCYPATLQASWRGDLFGHNLAKPATPNLDKLATLIRRMQNVPPEEAPQQAPPRVALLVDYASRLGDRQEAEQAVTRFLAAAEKAALDARPLARPDGSQLFNPVFWLANRAHDLPYWLTADNERTRAIPIPLPSSDTRERVAEWQFSRLGERDTDPKAFAERLASMTDNLSINAIIDIVSIAKRRNTPASQIAEAAEIYRVGDITDESPWRGDNLRKRIRAAESGDEPDIHLAGRIKGQVKAVTKVLDILKRTSIGLTGAQVKGSPSRPRGVLFFAGPTGVGKTEMAKTIARIVFGDESAYLRFDMSEFSAEHSGDRLIGAPPGYVGFDQGGELTNAMRERPFRVVLFDEIEKAHPRILDKFLQVLEDGRLTDGRGQTVYFSDALIIFTSNAGITKRNPDGHVDVLVEPELSENHPAEYEKRVEDGVRDYFQVELRRPELLNRMGENIVVFNFISKAVGYEILAAFVDNVQKRTQKEHGFELALAEPAKTRLRELCVDSDLTMGGRGIGSQVEAVLVNPFARLLFAMPQMPQRGSTLTIADIVDANNDGIWDLKPAAN